MKILGILAEGHSLTLEKLSLLERSAWDIKEKSISPDILNTLEGLVHYFNNEVDSHFRLEEKALFPVMAKYIGRAGFIEAMLEEHRSFWSAVETLGKKIEEWNASNKKEAGLALSIEQVASHIAAFLKSHIEKEEGSFFPLVEKTVGPASQAEIERLEEQLKAIYP